MNESRPVVEQDLVGLSRVQRPFCVPCFLFAGIRFQPPRPSCLPKDRFKYLLLRERRECRNERGTIKKLQGRVLVPPQGIYITVSLSSAAGTKAPTQVEDGNLRLSTRFPVEVPCYLATSQKKVTYSAAIIPNFAYKKLLPQNH